MICIYLSIYLYMYVYMCGYIYKYMYVCIVQGDGHNLRHGSNQSICIYVYMYIYAYAYISLYFELNRNWVRVGGCWATTKDRRLGLYTIFVRSKAFLHYPIILILPPPSALLTLLQYYCTTNTQYTTPTRPLLGMQYSIQYWQWQYRV